MKFVSTGIRSIFALLWAHRANVVPGILCLLVVDGAQIAIPLVVRRVVDGLVGGTAVKGWLALQAAVLLGLALTIALFRFAWRHFFFSTARRVEMDLRNRIFRHVLSLPSRFFTRARTGEVMALATNDVESVREAIAMGFVAGFDASAYALVALAAMAWLDPVLTLWTILPLPFLALLMLVSLKAIYNRWDRVQEAFEEMTEKARESIAGIRVLRAYVQEEGDCKEFEKISTDYFNKYIRYVKVDAMFHPAILTLAGICMAILIGVGGGRVIGGKTSLGDFVAFASYLGMLTWPMIAAGWLGSLLQRASASMDRIGGLLGESPESSAAGAQTRACSGEVEARDLTFSYEDGGRPALRGVTFRLEKGASLGVVGEVGSGKSTLAQLLSRAWDPPAGSLFLDGTDALEWGMEALRDAVAYVPQEAFLFSDTIAENLRVGRPEAARADMEEACRTASIHEEILGFPQGYDTLLGERGITLSGGQKQRLCLARALLKRAPLLVLDDTLSAVDSETERSVLKGLKDAEAGQTKVVVSHRVSAVRDLDEILVLKGGEVVQRGTHETLASLRGYYREMIELQEMVEN